MSITNDNKRQQLISASGPSWAVFTTKRNGFMPSQSVSVALTSVFLTPSERVTF